MRANELYYETSEKGFDFWLLLAYVLNLT